MHLPLSKLFAVMIFFACSTIFDISIPITRAAPAFAANIERIPVPHPTSSTVYKGTLNYTINKKYTNFSFILSFQQYSCFLLDFAYLGNTFHRTSFKMSTTDQYVKPANAKFWYVQWAKPLSGHAVWWQSGSRIMIRKGCR